MVGSFICVLMSTADGSCPFGHAWKLWCWGYNTYPSASSAGYTWSQGGAWTCPCPPKCHVPRRGHSCPILMTDVIWMCSIDQLMAQVWALGSLKKRLFFFFSSNEMTVQCVLVLSNLQGTCTTQLHCNSLEQVCPWPADRQPLQQRRKHMDKK